MHAMAACWSCQEVLHKKMLVEKIHSARQFQHFRIVVFAYYLYKMPKRFELEEQRRKYFALMGFAMMNPMRTNALRFLFPTPVFSVYLAEKSAYQSFLFNKCSRWVALDLFILLDMQRERERERRERERERRERERERERDRGREKERELERERETCTQCWPLLTNNCCSCHFKSRFSPFPRPASWRRPFPTCPGSATHSLLEVPATKKEKNQKTEQESKIVTSTLSRKYCSAVQADEPKPRTVWFK